MTGRTLRRLAGVAVAVPLVLLGVPAARAADAGTAQTYLVVYKAQSLPSSSVTAIKRAGGTVVASYSQIGVVVASSTSASFQATLAKDAKIQGVEATGAFATHVTDGTVRG